MPALEDIYRSHLDVVFRICSRYCQSRQEAEDLTQQVFLRLARSLSSFRGESDVGTWVYRLATNCCLDYLRRLKRERRLREDYFDSLVVKNLNSGGDRILAKVDMERILNQFRPRVREILFLTLAEGLNYREASEITGVSREAVAKIVIRFLKKFRGSHHGTAARELAIHFEPTTSLNKTV